MKLSLCFTILLPAIALAQTNFVNGNRLNERCYGQDPVLVGFCVGYIVGVADTNSKYICAPGGQHGVSVGQFESIVKKYLVENPAQLHKAADVIVLKALTEAFPCKKK